MKNDVINSNLLSFTEYFPSPSLEGQANAEGIYFPDWVTFDDEPERKVISWNGQFFTVLGDMDTLEYWEYLKPLVETFEIFLDGPNQDYNYMLDDSVQKAPEVKSIDRNIVTLIDGTRILRSTLTRKELSFYDYLLWLQTARAWINSPDDVIYSFRFLTAHPAFWTRNENYPNRCTTHGAETTFNSTVSNDSHGKPSITLEAGLPDRDNNDVMDYNVGLKVTASSFEEAYVEMAKLVHEKVALNGVLRQ